MYDFTNAARREAYLYGSSGFPQNGSQREIYPPRGFDGRRGSSVVIRRKADVRVGDTVYLRMDGRVFPYGRVTDITSDPTRPFVFDHGYVPVLAEGIRFAYAVRFLMVSHPVFGGSRGDEDR